MCVWTVAEEFSVITLPPKKKKFDGGLKNCGRSLVNDQSDRAALRHSKRTGVRPGLALPCCVGPAHLTRAAPARICWGQKRAVCVLLALGTSRRETGSNNNNKKKKKTATQASSVVVLLVSDRVWNSIFPLRTLFTHQSWQTKSLALHYGILVGPQMKDQLRLKTSEIEMSATILSGFYDIDMLYKVIPNFTQS